MTDSAQEVRDGILAYLRTNHPTICRHWFDDIQVVDFVGGRLRLLVPERFRLSYLRRSCLDHFNEAAQAVTSRLVAIEFVGEDEIHQIVRERQGTTHSVRVDEFSHDDHLNPDYTFDSFIHGPSNRMAFAAARAVAEKPGETFNPLFIYGGVGLGKTHLLQAVCREVMLRHPSRVARYVTCESFREQFMAAVQRSDPREFRERYRNVDVLAIDDIQFLSKRDISQEEFFHTFNTLHQTGRQVIMSSDCAPSELNGIEPRLISRFASGLPVDIVKPTFETRLSILKAKAALRPVHLPEDVLSYIGTQVDSNVRELEGAVTRLYATAQTYSRPIDLTLAKELFGPATNSGAAAQQLVVQDIIETVCKFYCVKIGDLLSRRKFKSIAQPRQVCMWLARNLTRHSLQEIGGFFGGRDHTTVLHAIRTVEDRQESDDRLKNDLSHLVALLSDQAG